MAEETTGQIGSAFFATTDRFRQSAEELRELAETLAAEAAATRAGATQEVRSTRLEIGKELEAVRSEVAREVRTARNDLTQELEATRTI